MQFRHTMCELLFKCLASVIRLEVVRDEQLTSVPSLFVALLCFGCLLTTEATGWWRPALDLHPDYTSHWLETGRTWNKDKGISVFINKGNYPSIMKEMTSNMAECLALTQLHLAYSPQQSLSGSHPGHQFWCFPDWRKRELSHGVVAYFRHKCQEMISNLNLTTNIIHQERKDLIRKCK